MNITRKGIIREEIWRAEEGPLKVDLALFVHVGNKVVLPYETLTAILTRAQFAMVESQARLPRASDDV